MVVRDPLGQFDPQRFFGARLVATPRQVLTGFILRWRVETPFEAARAHLGVETQRQGSTLAVQRATPLRLGVFAFVSRVADRWLASATDPLRTAAG